MTKMLSFSFALLTQFEASVFLNQIARLQNKDKDDSKAICRGIYEKVYLYKCVNTHNKLKAICTLDLQQTTF